MHEGKHAEVVKEPSAEWVPGRFKSKLEPVYFLCRFSNPRGKLARQSQNGFLKYPTRVWSLKGPGLAVYPGTNQDIWTPFSVGCIDQATHQEMFPLLASWPGLHSSFYTGGLQRDDNSLFFELLAKSFMKKKLNSHLLKQTWKVLSVLPLRNCPQHCFLCPHPHYRKGPTSLI